MTKIDGYITAIIIGFLLTVVTFNYAQKLLNEGVEKAADAVSNKVEKEIKKNIDKINEVIRKPVSFEDALKLAGENKKNVLLVFSKKDCAWCKKLEETTLQDAATRLLLNKYVVFTVKSEENKELAKKYGVDAFPTTVVVSPDGTAIRESVGFKKSVDFNKFLEAK